jgi:hypothetical protein
MGRTPRDRKPSAALLIVVASVSLASCSGSSDNAEPQDDPRPSVELAQQTVTDASPPSEAIVVATTPPSTTTTTTTTIVDDVSPPPQTGGGQATPNGNEVAFEAGATQSVGADIVPGLYMAQAGDGFCSWERTTSDGTVVDNIYRGQIVQEILASDTKFTSDEECGTWAPYAAPATPATTIDEGLWAVNQQIVPGTYRTDDATFEFCYWERSSGFTLTADEIIINSIETEQVEVVILPTDARFVSSGCGTWTLVG